MVDVKALQAPTVEAQIDTATLATIIRSGVDAVVLDARTGRFDDGRRIPGARSLGAECTPEEAERVIGRKDALIVTYCSGIHCPASSRLYGRLRELGYENVLEYLDGIKGWTAQGYPIEERSSGG